MKTRHKFFGRWHSVKEKCRTYTFPNGDITFLNVTRFMVRSKDGAHYLETRDGKKHIVNTTWLTMTIRGEWLP